MNPLHGSSLVVTWIALAVGVLTLSEGIRGLVTQSRGPGNRLPSRTWNPTLIGLFILIETIPRVSRASDNVVFTLSLVAFIPLGVMVVVAGRSARG